MTEQQSVLPDINRKDFVLTDNNRTAAKIVGTLDQLDQTN